MVPPMPKNACCPAEIIPPDSLKLCGMLQLANRRAETLGLLRPLLVTFGISV
jgi:hypothetical protein